MVLYQGITGLNERYLFPFFLSQNLSCILILSTRISVSWFGSWLLKTFLSTFSSFPFFERFVDSPNLFSSLEFVSILPIILAHLGFFCGQYSLLFFQHCDRLSLLMGCGCWTGLKYLYILNELNLAKLEVWTREPPADYSRNIPSRSLLHISVLNWDRQYIGGHPHSSIHYEVNMSVPIYCPSLFSSIV